ncbi:hypothetical protein [Yimella sp. cx-51]|uniref:hypothetical protein n=1 Tax=Yimella sp. cx-51 TaxID=2770551 RepID=UPI0019BF60C6|nr:hypothetical protein [Yimella sp. cx-51]MBC9955611.1 hypothetical protein [Yimella sp. cx-51]QTH37813.1 hypothetical protein J5M86_13335 [Yimella sp. cx-51]
MSWASGVVAVPTTFTMRSGAPSTCRVKLPLSGMPTAAPARDTSTSSGVAGRRPLFKVAVPAYTGFLRSTPSTSDRIRLTPTTALAEASVTGWAVPRATAPIEAASVGRLPFHSFPDKPLSLTFSALLSRCLMPNLSPEVSMAEATLAVAAP